MIFLPKELENIIIEDKNSMEHSEKYRNVMSKLIECANNRNIIYKYIYIDGGFGNGDEYFYGSVEGCNVLYFIRKDWKDDCAIYEHFDKYMYEFTNR